MRYAKLIDGEPVYAPNPVLVGDNYVGNPPAELLRELGYKPVTFTDYPSQEPDEGYYWAETWTETCEAIVQGWVQEPIPEEE